jgi:hypothetical protein
MPKLYSAAIMGNTGTVARVIVSEIIDGVIEADWEKHELRILTRRITIPGDMEQQEIFEKAKLFRAENWFVEIDGDLQKISRIDVDCSDVPTSKECEASCPCYSEPQSPQQA